MNTETSTKATDADPATTLDHLDPGPSTEIPTFTMYLDRLRASMSAVTVTNYQTYWRVIESHWGTRTLDDITVSEVAELMAHCRRHAVVRANFRDGSGAANGLLSALRCLYRRAEYDDYIRPRDNPAMRIARVQQQRPFRPVVTRAQVEQVIDTVPATGDDPELDTLILRLHRETAARRSGILALTVGDLDTVDCSVRVHGYGGSTRRQPITPSLVRCLARHQRDRGDPEVGSPLLRHASGRPLGRRRYENITARCRATLPWAGAVGFSPDLMSQATLAWVEHEFGAEVALAYAGTSPVRDICVVASVLAALCGESHPLAVTAVRRTPR